MVGSLNVSHKKYQLALSIQLAESYGGVGEDLALEILKRQLVNETGEFIPRTLKGSRPGAQGWIFVWHVTWE